MSAQNGALVLLKMGDGGTPTETFTTIGGMRANSFTLNNQAVDATNKDSGAWRQLLEGAGIRAVSLSGSGIFTDSAAEETLRSAAFNNSIDNYELHFGNGDKLSGAFQITSYNRGGSYDGEETYSASFASAGAITFTTV